MHQTFRRAERLKSRKLIKAVFAARQSVSTWPIRLIWLHRPIPSSQGADELPPVQVAFAVPRKHLRRAVARNKVRRRLREAWRLHKHELYSAMARRRCRPLAVVVLYLGKGVLPWREIEPAMVRAMQRLARTACSDKADASP